MKVKKILAMIGVVLLVGMYVATLIFALGKNPLFQTMFYASLAATFIIPVLIYIMILIAQVLQNKKSAYIDSIIFDVGFVLADFPWKAYARQQGVSEANISLYEKRLVGTPLWREFDRGEKTTEEIIDEMAASLPGHEEEIHRLLPEAFSCVHAFPYTESWLKSLKEKGYKLYILSNWPGFAYDMLKDTALSFESLMDGAVWSYRVRQVKPDKAIFDTLRDTYQLDPARSVFIDDTMENILAARKYGYPAIQFRGLAETQKQLASLGVK